MPDIAELFQDGFEVRPLGLFKGPSPFGLWLGEGDLEAYALVVTPKVIQHDFPVGDVHLGSHGEIDDSRSQGRAECHFLADVLQKEAIFGHKFQNNLTSFVIFVPPHS